MTSRVDILIKAQDNASKEFSKVKTELEKLNGNVKTASSEFGGLGSVIKSLVGTAGLLALKNAVTNVMTAFADSEAEMTKVYTILNTLDSATLKHAGGLQNLKQQIEAVSKANIQLGFDDEDTAVSISRLTQATGDYNEALVLNNVAMDLSRYSGRDLASASEALIKVQAGQTRVLKEFGIETKDGISTQEAFRAILEKTKGQAEAYANTIKGKSDVMKRSFQDLKEELGKSLSPAFEELIKVLIPVIQQTTERIKKNPELARTLTLVGGGLTTVLGLVAIVGPVASKAIKGISAMTVAFNALYAAAAGAGIAVGSFLGKQFDKASNFLETGKRANTEYRKQQNTKKTTSSSDTMPVIDIPGFDSLKIPNIQSATGSSDKTDAQKEALEKLKDEMSEYGKQTQKASEFHDKFKQTFNDAINESKDKIKDLKKQLEDLGKSETKDLAERYVEIGAEIKKRTAENQKISSEGSINENADKYLENIQKIKQLEDEKKLATQGMDQGQIDAFNKAVESQQAYYNMTDIEKIKADYQAKRDEINTTLTQETAAVNSIYQLKSAAEKNRLALFNSSKDEQLVGLQALINKTKELARTKSSTGTGTSSSSTSAKAGGGDVITGQQYVVGENGPEYFVPALSGKIIPNSNIGSGISVNINMGGVVVNNESDENRLVDKIKKTLTRELELHKMGVF